MKTKTNTIAKIMFCIGLFIIVAGFIGSFICGRVFEREVGYYYTYTEYNWAIAIFGSIGSFFLGAFYIALAEIIELLEKTNKKNENIHSGIGTLNSLMGKVKKLQEQTNDHLNRMDSNININTLKHEMPDL